MYPGQCVGQYELICQTAEGGMASVWLARATGSRGFTKVVAIKAMLPESVDDPDAERSFLAEASVASRIDHPNVVQTIDLCEEAGALYLVMEWVRGETLSTIYSAAAARGGMPLGTAVRIVLQALQGLHAAHELSDASGRCLGLVHRDVSPHNVLVGFNGVVKLADFGIAKLAADASDGSELGQLRGKVAYMAPEQIRLESVDRRADIFATGILLYLLTTGRHPFKGADQNETALAILSNEAVTPPSSFSDQYPPKLERVVLRALSKDAGDRYATAREFNEELVRALPPSFQGAGHDELRAYMKNLLPDQLAKHQQLVRVARDAPDRTFASSPVPIGQVFKQAGRSSSTLRAVAVSTEPGPSSVAASPDDAGSSDAPLPRRSHGKIAVAFVAGGLAIAVAVVGLTRAPVRSGVLQAGSTSPPEAESAPGVAPSRGDGQNETAANTVSAPPTPTVEVAAPERASADGQHATPERSSAPTAASPAPTAVKPNPPHPVRAQKRAPTPHSDGLVPKYPY